MKIQQKEFEDGELVIYVDYSRSDHAGAGGCFQIVNIEIEREDNVSILDDINIDPGVHYHDIKDVLKDLELDSMKVDFRVECV